MSAAPGVFVCWLWRGRGFWKRTASYDERHVAVLASMLKRHGGHDLICVHDGSFAPSVPSIVMPAYVAEMSDYMPKLWAWAPEFHTLVGQRFASIDLDVVITGDLGPVLASERPLRIWAGKGERFNTSLFALEPGFGHGVWQCLSPEAIGRAKAAASYWTGDQSLVAYILGEGHDTFGDETGVMQYRPRLHRDAKPAGMIAGFMCGPYEPFSEAEQSAWVREAYH